MSEQGSPQDWAGLEPNVKGEVELVIKTRARGSGREGQCVTRDMVTCALLCVHRGTHEGMGIHV